MYRNGNEKGATPAARLYHGLYGLYKTLPLHVGLIEQWLWLKGTKYHAASV